MIPNKKGERSHLFHGFTAALTVIFVFLIVLCGGIMMIERSVGDKVYPRVTVEGVSLAGLTKTEARNLVRARAASVLNGSLTVLYQTQPIATFSARTLHARLNIDDVVEQAWLIGRVSHVPSRLIQQINTTLGIRSYSFTTSVIYDGSVVEEFLSTAKESYEKPAKNALFSFKDGRVTEFRAEENGVKLQDDRFTIDVHRGIQLLKQSNANITVDLSTTTLLPEVTLAQSNDYGIEELIGEGQSDYTGSIPGRVHNVILGTSKFNGVLIPKGETFSFNETVGDISALTGYQPAYIIQNGKTVLGDGGGICQVSSTLFRAALNAGLPVIERTAHAYRVHYYENDRGPGFDATVFSPTVDLKIKNDTSAAILIQTDVDEENLLVHFRLYGKKDGRKAEISKAEVWDVSAPPEPSYQDDPSLPRGVTKQVDFSAWGAKARFHYKVSYPSGEVKDELFYSVYKPWRAVFLVGTKD